MIGLRPVWSSVISVVAAAMALLAASALADRFLDLRLDATHAGLFTLSAGTRQVLAQLHEPVTLRLFASARLAAEPGLGPYAERVTQMLHRYVDAAGGSLRLEVLDPEPFTEAEDRAIAAGLTKLPLDATGEQAYFGLVATNSTDGARSIGFLRPDRDRFLEYDLTQLVAALSDPHPPAVGILSPLPLDLVAGAAMQELRQSFDLRSVALDADRIDPALAALLVAHPQNLAPATLFAIDQFVMRGGGLLLLLDPHSEAQAGQGAAETASDLPALLHAWGVTYDPDAAIGNLDGAWRVQAGEGDRVQAVDYPAWFTLRDGIARDDPATANLSAVTLAAPGALAFAPGTAATPLLTTGSRAGPIPAASLRGQPDPAAILAAFHPDGLPHVLAARLGGPLVSAFPDRTGAIARTEAAHVVVVADSDILDDRFWVRMQDGPGQPEAHPFADNGPFVANLVGSLAGGDRLIGLRGRGGALRPLTAIDDLRRDADIRYRRSEQALRAHLDQTVARLASLRGDPHAGALSAEQRGAIDDLLRDIGDTRMRLRAVQLDLRRDVDALGWRWRLFCVFLMPALVAVAAIGHGLWRMRAS